MHKYPELSYQEHKTMAFVSETLTKLGVKRISMGNFLFDKMYVDFEEKMKNILSQNSFKSIF